MVAYEGNEPYVFISYAHKDKGKVLPIIQGLQDRGFRVWYDEGIEVGNEWPDFIAEHIEGCCGMVAFVSRNFGESDNCREELSFAKELKKTIIVIFLEDRQKLRSGVRMRLSTQHSMNLGDYADNAAFINELSKAKALKPCLGVTAAPAPKKPAEPSAEELFKQGEAYYDRKEYEKAIPLLKKAADRGYACAQFRLGRCMECGNGVIQNHEEAAKWYRKAAEQGHVIAQYNLGVLYDDGLGVPQNQEEAVKWYRKAAEQDDADAQNNLGVCYKRGEGVPQNYEEAVKWYRKAADQGNAAAQNNLGVCYKLGEGVPQNYEEAIKWYRMAANQGDSSAQYNLAMCYEFGTGVRKNKVEARKWYQKAADQGDADAIRKLKTL